MKTWGLHKKSSLHTWGLRGIIIKIWSNSIRVIVGITRSLRV